METELFVVIGDTTVARRLCSSLAERGEPVRHLACPDEGELVAMLAAAPACGVAVLFDDDVVALRYALAVANIQPGVAMVVTVFDRTIGDQLARFLPHCTVTSPADLAVPSLAGPCLDRNLVAVTRSGSGIRGVRSVSGTVDEVPVQGRRRKGWRTAAHGLARMFGSHEVGVRILLTGLLGLATVLVADWAWLVLGAGHGAVESFGEAVRVVTTVGPAGEVDGDPVYAVLASMAMLATIVFTAMFTAGVVDRLIGPRLTAVWGSRALPRSGHVVVVGLGQVGLRLCRELRELGVPVVGVERDPHARNLHAMRDDGIPAVVGDGTDRALLERVGVRRAIALAAVSSDDRDNIAVSLAAQAAAPEVRSVLRAGEKEIIAETGSLLPLGVIRDVTSLSATYVLAHLLGAEPVGVVAGRSHVHVLRSDGEYVELPVAARSGCRHLCAGGAVHGDAAHGTRRA
jgi:hypothetical protein